MALMRMQGAAVQGWHVRVVTVLLATPWTLSCDVDITPRLGSPRYSNDGGPDGSLIGGNAGNGTGGASGTAALQCMLNNGGCSYARSCSVEDGEVVCGPCPEGTEALGDRQCQDKNECTTGEHDCDTEAPARCMNIVMSYICVCPFGTLDVNGDGSECVSEPGVDGGGIPDLRCTVNNGGCSQARACEIEDGEIVCGPCPEGAEDRGDGRQCSDIDECATGTHNCDTDPPARCMNTLLGFVCICPANSLDAHGDGTECLTQGGSGAGGASGASGSGAGGAGGAGAVDECALGIDECDDDPEATCTDLPVGYTCTCPVGYRDTLTQGRNCVDIVECGTGATGTDWCDISPAATCIDNPNGLGFECICPDGYFDALLNLAHPGEQCTSTPPDECTLGADDCDPIATCINNNDAWANPLPRGYSCECPDGYQDVNGDGTECADPLTCSDETECDDDPDACVDDGDSYRCECPAGYADVEGDGTDCVDLDECTLNTHACDQDPVATCENTIGSYLCHCPDGTVDVLGDGTQCTPTGSLIALSNSSTCAIMQGGIVKCWGGNAFGELGLGDTQLRGDSPTEIPALLPAVDLDGPAVQLAAGCSHNCALLADGAVKCWGRNISAPEEPLDEGAGQLGQGDRANRGDGPGEMGANLEPVPLGMAAAEVAAGCEFTCARLIDGSVKCWGGNYWGQLGQGHTDSIGDDPGEIEALEPIALGAPATKLRVGYRFACAQLGSALKCWGRNRNGQLGQPALTHPMHPNHLGDEPNELGDNLPPIDFGDGRSVVEFTAGFISACVILDNADMKCWGGSRNGIGYGKAGLNPDINLGDGPDEMGDFLPPIDLPGIPVALAAHAQTCVVFDDATLACFGNNEHGMLGIGSLEAISDEPDEMGSNLMLTNLGTGARVKAVRTGLGHTCAILETGDLKCWGSNQRGQLGHGILPLSDRGDEPGEMGDALPTSLDLWSRPSRPVRDCDPSATECAHEIHITQSEHERDEAEREHRELHTHA